MTVIGYSLLVLVMFALVVLIAIHTPPQPHDPEAVRRMMRDERRRPEREKR